MDSIILNINKSAMKKYPRVLTIAGSDSGGGAGIQADIKTISALGCYATSVITAVTVQNTLGVTAVHPVPADIIEKQIDAVLSDIGTDAVKIGMLHSAEAIKAVKKGLIKYKIRKIVLDTVMVAASGDKLMEDSAVDVLIKELFPIAAVITPNLNEAESILGERITSVDDMARAAEKLLELASNAILLKGGHLEGDKVCDIYMDKSGYNPVLYENKKIKSNNIHGTGCTLSSAIAAFLARRHDVTGAVKNAQRFTYNAICNGKDYKTGRGRGPLNHFFDPQILKEL
jgi:hydroxymethylpyrimidine/phosphomethylpyrimidine kinase